MCLNFEWKLYVRRNSSREFESEFSGRNRVCDAGALAALAGALTTALRSDHGAVLQKRGAKPPSIILGGAEPSSTFNK